MPVNYRSTPEVLDIVARAIARATVKLYQKEVEAGASSEQAAQAAGRYYKSVLGPGTRAAQTKVKTWIDEKHPEVEEEERLDIPDQPVSSSSGWVQSAGLQGGTLVVTFKGNRGGPDVRLLYPGFTKQALDSLLSSGSAGRWVRSNIYGAMYRYA